MRLINDTLAAIIKYINSQVSQDCYMLGKKSGLQVPQTMSQS